MHKINKVSIITVGIIAIFIYPLIVVYNLTSGESSQFIAFWNTHWTGASVIMLWYVISSPKAIKKTRHIKINLPTWIVGKEKDKPGFIYVMRRQDGIYKIGKTNNVQRRLSQHTKDYGMSFEVVKRFVVFNTDSFERMALKMTSLYSYQEEGRQELRKMNGNQLGSFLTDFKTICQQGVDA